MEKTASKSKKPKRRLVQGRDWHGWAARYVNDDGTFEYGMNAHGSKPLYTPTAGSWVRVKFVKVD